MELNEGTPVEIYWNLHKGIFSVRSRRTSDYGRVIAHVNDFTLRNVTFVVHEKGRQKVLAEKRKNVHAFIRGIWTNIEQPSLATKVSYNPYKGDSFQRTDGLPVYGAGWVSGIVDFSGHPHVTV